ncbi:MAG TPA: GTP cyclohydrolase II [Spirochaetota bacterium]|nr:GTP cyclohydrolase II [Spirochaetota bacterium]HOS33924.1 GTP cyclohydrolase II [Spirochaetota bacterium]HOS56881.1 GTP cyclohydrolase II [Spirochaetota bacterium]HPK62442.1 GTP cyclohydrolase II [Spirochaetota bacterium]HQF78547.1 GTP cyclohydrolase II [Spirochaetota bacterium]
MTKIKKLLEAFSKGEITVVFDDEDRENEADLIVAIDKLTPEKVNFLATYGKGLVCAAVSGDIARNKGFPLMPTLKNDLHQTAFTISVDSVDVKTGISPYERYITAKNLIDPSKTLKDFVTPGHLFPLAAKRGGLLERRGHTEAAASLCKWAGLNEGALICEMVKDDGNMLSIEESKKFAEEFNLPFCTVEELVEYQKTTYSNVEKVSSAKLTSEYGIFDITIYKELYTDKEHVFLSMGDYKNGFTRIHSECLTGDVFFSKSCDCNNQLRYSLRKIAEEGKGAIIYLRQEGRGIGLGQKIKAYALQQNDGMDTVEANICLGYKDDERDFHQAAWILKDQGYTSVKIFTNNPKKISYLKKHDFKIEILKGDVCVFSENYKYLYTKKTKMGHDIDMDSINRRKNSETSSCFESQK